MGWGRKPGLCLRRFKEGPLSGAAEARAPRGTGGLGLGALRAPHCLSLGLSFPSTQ